MRITPKALFFGLLSLGLPIAVTIGWVLGATTTVTPPAAAPNGTGVLGSAPPRPDDKPVNPVEYQQTERPSGSRSASSTAPPSVRPRSPEPSVSPTASVPASPEPSPSEEASEEPESSTTPTLLPGLELPDLSRKF